jgi:hypothetical protein
MILSKEQSKFEYKMIFPCFDLKITKALIPAIQNCTLESIVEAIKKCIFIYIYINNIFKKIQNFLK